MRGQGVQRKVFRIEQMVGGGRASRPGSQRDHAQAVAASEPHQQPQGVPVLASELAAIRSLIDRNTRELSMLINDGGDRPDDTRGRRARCRDRRHGNSDPVDSCVG